MHNNLRSLLISVTLCGLIAGVCQAQSNLAILSPEYRLRAAIQNYLQNPPLRNFKPTSYLFAFVDLAGNGKRQAVAYLTGTGWCGSSGCTLLVLTQDVPSYKVISRIPGVKLPIRTLDTRSHGWRDLSVFIQGGGVVRGYDEMVRYDGEGYVQESTGSGERTSARKLEGEIILSWTNKEVQLYP